MEKMERSGKEARENESGIAEPPLSLRSGARARARRGGGGVRHKPIACAGLCRKQVLVRPEPGRRLLRLAPRLATFPRRHVRHLDGRPLGLQLGNAQPGPRQQPRHPVERERRQLGERRTPDAPSLLPPAEPRRRTHLRALRPATRARLQGRAPEDPAALPRDQQDQDQGRPRPDAHRREPQALRSREPGARAPARPQVATFQRHFTSRFPSFPTNVPTTNNARKAT
jgi:hypothetical protein